MPASASSANSVRMASQASQQPSSARMASAASWRTIACSPARRRLSARPSGGSLRYVRRRAPPVAVRGNASGGGGDGGAKEEDREDKEAVASAGLGSPEVSKQRTAHAAAPEMDTAARGALAQRMQFCLLYTSPSPRD